MLITLKFHFYSFFQNKDRNRKIHYLMQFKKIIFKYYASILLISLIINLINKKFFLLKLVSLIIGLVISNIFP